MHHHLWNMFIFTIKAKAVFRVVTLLIIYWRCHHSLVPYANLPKISTCVRPIAVRLKTGRVIFHWEHATCTQRENVFFLSAHVLISITGYSWSPDAPFSCVIRMKSWELEGILQHTTCHRWIELTHSLTKNNTSTH
jgi:hypothetical protein